MAFYVEPEKIMVFLDQKEGVKDAGVLALKP